MVRKLARVLPPTSIKPWSMCRRGDLDGVMTRLEEIGWSVGTINRLVRVHEDPKKEMSSLRAKSNAELSGACFQDVRVEDELPKLYIDQLT
jgi:hypothetical protein